MRVILTDRSVVAAAVVTVAVVLAFLILPSSWRRSELAVAAGLAAGYFVASPALDRYLETPDPIRTWMPALLALGVAGTVVGAGWALVRPAASPNLTIAVALAAGGVFACIPETGIVRFVMPPILLVGIAVAVGLIQPLHPAIVVALAAGLAWLSWIDGLTRGSAIIGAAACIGAAALVPLMDTDTLPPLGFSWARVTLAVAVLLFARWAGLVRSTTTAVVLVAAIAAAAAAALAFERRRPAQLVSSP